MNKSKKKKRYFWTDPLKSLITGVTSCSGSYLAEYLLEKGYEVFGTKRKSSSLDNINHILNKIKIFNIDLNNNESILNILEQCNPDQIYLLAAANQFQVLSTIYKTNVEGTITFFESLIKSSCNARILIISSSAVYGVQEEIRHLTERADLLPSGHYGLSKVLQEEIASYYNRNYDLDVIIARPFNFTGPREYPLYVCTDFVKQIIGIENGKRNSVIKIGNLGNKRDFTDVRDIVRGYELLAQKGIKGEAYNLCSGNAFSIKTILDKLLSLSVANIDIEVNPDKKKAEKTNAQLGDHSKIFSKTGWKPEISLDRTLEDMLIYYRKPKKT